MDVFVKVFIAKLCLPKSHPFYSLTQVVRVGRVWSGKIGFGGRFKASEAS